MTRYIEYYEVKTVHGYLYYFMPVDAEASAIRARGAALRDNPTLIELVQAERWNGILPTTMIPGSTVPFLNVGQ